MQEIDIEITTTKMNTERDIIKKIFLIIMLALAVGVIGYFVGNQSFTPQEKIEYIPSERLDSLDVALDEVSFFNDSIDGELKPERIKIDGTMFLSDEKVEEIVKVSYDELHNQTPSYIDTLFIHEYDSAVSARRLYYNGQR